MNIAVIAGGNRINSTSTLLLRYMEKELSKQDIEVTFIDLHKLPLPLYSADQPGVTQKLQLPIFTSPETMEYFESNVKQLVAAAQNADGIILGTPEYHGSFSGTLKNGLDYLGSAQFEGKPVLVASSAAGAVGVSSLTQLQTVVRNLHGINCTEWVSIGGDSRNFGEDGEPEQDKVKQRVLYALEHLTRLVRQLRLSGE
ncbi:NADPH-dependent FMN reductase [Paenibacillus sp. D51F]